MILIALSLIGLGFVAFAALPDTETRPIADIVARYREADFRASQRRFFENNSRWFR